MKMNTLLGAVAASFVALAAAGAASASTVVYSSVPDLGAYPSVNAWCSDCYGGSTYEPLDQFTLGQSAKITGVNLMALDDYGYSATTPFTFEVYDSTHSSILFSQTIAPTLVSTNGYGDSLVTGAVSGLNLSAGTYWAGFIAPTFAIPGYTGGNGTLIDTQPHTGTKLFDLGGNTGYQLLSAVPEPTSWALMLMGIGGVGLAMRTRRRSAPVAAALTA